MNRAMGQLLTTRESIDTHCRKQVSDTKTTFCQNEAQTAEAIKEVKAHCATVIQDAEATCAAAIREDIEREPIEEKGRDCQSFLTACRVALQACPPRST